MKVGDVVIPVGDAVLASGCGRYDCAIVASVEPFALASVAADMLWTCTIRPEDVRPLCQAAPYIVARAVERYELHTSNHANERKPDQMVQPAPCKICGTGRYIEMDADYPAIGDWLLCTRCGVEGPIARPGQNGSHSPDGERVRLWNRLMSNDEIVR